MVGWLRYIGFSKNSIRAPYSSYDAYTKSCDMLVGYRGSENNLKLPPPNWHPPLVPLFRLGF